MLELDLTTYFILISSMVNFAFNLALVGFLVVNFFRKKTVGTAMLLLAYTFFALTSAVSIAYRWLYILEEEISEIGYFLGSLGPLILLPSFAYLYIFACRHILKDSEILRTNIFAVIIFFYGLATAVVAIDNFSYFSGAISSRVFSAPVFITSTETIFTVSYSSSGLFIQIFQIIISIYVTGRIGFRAYRLAAKSDQPVRKRGLQSIGLGVLLYLFAGMLSAFDSTFASIPALMIIVAVLRSLVFAFAYIMMYLGWIMPAWYRKMIRKRSWFEIQYTNMTKGA